MDNLFLPVSSISFMLCLCHFIKFIVCSDHLAYLPGDVSINCGSVGTFAAQNGREWLGDTHPIFASSLQIKGKSTISSAAGNSVPADPIPYKAARISSSGFSYVFLVNPGTRKRSMIVEDDIAPSKVTKTISAKKLKADDSLKIIGSKSVATLKPRIITPPKVKAVPRTTATKKLVPKVQSATRRYSTRHSSKLTTHFSNTSSTPITVDDEESPFHGKEHSQEISSGESFGDDNSSSTETGNSESKASVGGISRINEFDSPIDTMKDLPKGLPASDPDPSPLSTPVATLSSLIPSPQDFSSRRARLKLISDPETQVDLSFSDVAPSFTSDVARSVPSIEVLAHARLSIQNFLNLGLRHLGESQRLAMLSSASILRSSSDFLTSEFSLLDDLPTLFSRSDKASTVSAEMISRQQSFLSKREEKDGLEAHDQVIREQILQETASYDTDEAEIKRLEEVIKTYKANMAASLDRAEMLEAKLLSNRTHSRLLGHQLLNLKSDYQQWTVVLKETENTQSECVAKWELLRALFS